MGPVASSRGVRKKEGGGERWCGCVGIGGGGHWNDRRRRSREENRRTQEMFTCSLRRLVLFVFRQALWFQRLKVETVRTRLRRCVNSPLWRRSRGPSYPRLWSAAGIHSPPPPPPPLFFPRWPLDELKQALTRKIGLFLLKFTLNFYHHFA